MAFQPIDHQEQLLEISSSVNQARHTQLDPRPTIAADTHNLSVSSNIRASKRQKIGHVYSTPHSTISHSQNYQIEHVNTTGDIQSSDFFAASSQSDHPKQHPKLDDTESQETEDTQIVQASQTSTKSADVAVGEEEDVFDAVQDQMELAAIRPLKPNDTISAFETAYHQACALSGIPTHQIDSFISWLDANKRTKCSDTELDYEQGCFDAIKLAINQARASAELPAIEDILFSKPVGSPTAFFRHLLLYPPWKRGQNTSSTILSPHCFTTQCVIGKGHSKPNTIYIRDSFAIKTDLGDDVPQALTTQQFKRPPSSRDVHIFNDDTAAILKQREASFTIVEGSPNRQFAQKELEKNAPLNGFVIIKGAVQERLPVLSQRGCTDVKTFEEMWFLRKDGRLHQTYTFVIHSSAGWYRGTGTIERFGRGFWNESVKNFLTNVTGGIIKAGFDKIIMTSMLPFKDGKAKTQSGCAHRHLNCLIHNALILKQNVTKAVIMARGDIVSLAAKYDFAIDQFDDEEDVGRQLASFVCKTYWHRMPPDVYLARCDAARDRWHALSRDERQTHIDKRLEGKAIVALLEKNIVEIGQCAKTGDQLSQEAYLACASCLTSSSQYVDMTYLDNQAMAVRAVEFWQGRIERRSKSRQRKKDRPQWQSDLRAQSKASFSQSSSSTLSQITLSQGSTSSTAATVLVGDSTILDHDFSAQQNHEVDIAFTEVPIIGHESHAIDKQIWVEENSMSRQAAPDDVLQASNGVDSSAQAVRDAEGRYEYEPDYDSSTFFISETALRSLTPQQREYWSIKICHYDTILLVQRGKTFKVLGRDAEVVAKEFNRKLVVSKQMSMAESEVERLTGELLKRRYKVAVATFDHDRGISLKSFTHSLYYSTLSEFVNVYCVAVRSTPDADEPPSPHSCRQSTYGICVLDASLAEFQLAEICDDGTSSNLSRLLRLLAPAEIVYQKGSLTPTVLNAIKCSTPAACRLTAVAARDGSGSAPRDSTTDFIDKVACAEFFRSITVFTAHKLMNNVLETMQEHLLCFDEGKLADVGTFKSLDILAPCLNIVDSAFIHIGLELDQLATSCKTCAGRRMLNKWLLCPLFDESSINNRLDAVQVLIDNIDLKETFDNVFHAAPDVERVLTKIHLGSCSIPDFLNAVQGLETMQIFANEMTNLLYVGPALLQDCVDSIAKSTRRLERVKSLYLATGDDHHLQPPAGSNVAFDAILQEISEIEIQLEAKLLWHQQETGIDCLSFNHSRGKEYQLETMEDDIVPEYWIQVSETACSSRYYTALIKLCVERLKNARKRRSDHLELFRKQVYEAFSQDKQIYAATVQACAQIDCLFTLAQLSTSFGHRLIRPRISHPGSVLDIRDLRFEEDDCFTSLFLGRNRCETILYNSVLAEKNEQLIAIIKAIILAQLGCFVPAAHFTFSPLSSVEIVTKKDGLSSSVSVKLDGKALVATYDGFVAVDISSLSYYNDGYRLTYGGYDYLAMRTFAVRETVYSVGNQIGTGKESDIYVVADAEGNQLCCKIHRLGRISFRQIKTKRDYLRKGQSASWMYLSRISAKKEFAFMQVLHEHGFPVPRPVDQARHCVVMELIDAFPLRQVSEVGNPAVLYSTLMDLIVQLAQVGLIHGDFNEFNILLRETEEGEPEPILIDFPQMVSVDHENAEFFFNRDVDCIRSFFKRKFSYESLVYPVFETEVNKDGDREHRLDVKVEASGWKRGTEEHAALDAYYGPPQGPDVAEGMEAIDLASADEESEAESGEESNQDSTFESDEDAADEQPTRSKRKAKPKTNDAEEDERDISSKVSTSLVREARSTARHHHSKKAVRKTALGRPSKGSKLKTDVRRAIKEES